MYCRRPPSGSSDVRYVAIQLLPAVDAVTLHSMALEPIAGTPARVPPGRVVVQLNDEHRRAYRMLYARYRTILDGLPVLRDRDFDGRRVKMTAAQLDALNAAFAGIAAAERRSDGAFDAQERGRTSLFKRLQYLS